MAEYTMEDVFEDVILDIGGSRFKLRERTKSLGEKADKLSEKARAVEKALEDEEKAAEISDDDAMAPAFDLLDLLLEPLGDGNNGTRTHVKTILAKAYKNDEIGSDRIWALLNFCQDKMLGRMDPTSRQTSDA